MIWKVQINVKKHRTPLRELLGTLVPAGVLTWALGMLTASYMGHAKVDSAFACYQCFSGLWDHQKRGLKQAATTAYHYTTFT
jgi:hypothetical protein